MIRTVCVLGFSFSDRVRSILVWGTETADRYRTPRISSKMLFVWGGRSRTLKHRGCRKEPDIRQSKRVEGSMEWGEGRRVGRRSVFKKFS